jgi:hypothetical protein
VHARRFVAAMAFALIAASGIVATAAGAAQLGILDRPAARLDHSIRNHKRRDARRQHKPQRSRWALPAGVSRPTLDSIGACESGGDPSAVDASGTYRGKYQFDYGTWASVGGSGDPAAAAEAEQDYRAALLYERSGSTPWPVCG